MVDHTVERGIADELQARLPEAKIIVATCGLIVLVVDDRDFTLQIMDGKLVCVEIDDKILGGGGFSSVHCIEDPGNDFVGSLISDIRR